MNTNRIKLVTGLSLVAMAVVTLAPTQANANLLREYSNDGVVAQNWGNNRWHHGGWNNNNSNSRFDEITQRISMLSAKISRGQQDGRLTGREASGLRRSLDRVNNLADKMKQSNRRIDQNEFAALNDRLSNLDSKINRELSDAQHRWNRPF